MFPPLRTHNSKNVPITTLINGLIGGLLATVVMTIIMMMRGDDSPPPTALFWLKYIGEGEPSAFVMQGMVLHLIYGIAAGRIIALFMPLIGFVSVSTIFSAIAWGLIYGIVLFIGAAVFWMKIILGIDTDMKMAGLFLFFHLVYGAILGAWIGLDIL